MQCTEEILHEKDYIFNILRLTPRWIFSKNSKARSKASISEEAHLLKVSPIIIYWHHQLKQNKVKINIYV